MATEDIDALELARFEIEQYELHVATYEIEAWSAAEAIERLLTGDGTALNGSEFIGTCDEVGIATKDAPDLAAEVRRRGVELRGSIIPSIRAVRRMDGAAPGSNDADGRG